MPARRMHMQSVKELMTRNPICLERDTSVREAARRMRDRNIGDVLVVDDQKKLCGILTDRDIVVRCIADNRDPDATTIGEICTRQVHKVSPDANVDEAIRLMRDVKVRRLPVMDDGVPQGIISLGDLAESLDPHSVLGELSSAPPQN